MHVALAAVFARVCRRAAALITDPGSPVNPLAAYVLLTAVSEETLTRRATHLLEQAEDAVALARCLSEPLPGDVRVLRDRILARRALAPQQPAHSATEALDAALEEL